MATLSAPSRLHLSLVLLSFSAGAADAFAFLALGGIFTANMTGNLILVGMFTRTGFAETVLGAGVAIICFVGLLYAAFRLTAGGPADAARVPHVVARLLLPSLAAQAAVVVVWLIAWATPGQMGAGGVGLGGVAQWATIALSASALALQTVAAKKLSDVDGVTTTYVTGTLTTTMQALAERRGGGQGLRVLSVLALPVGAVCGTAVLAFLTPGAPALPLVAALVATALLALRTRATGRGSSPAVP